MEIGMLGPIVFEVSSEKVRTFQSAQKARNIKIQNHDRHGMVQLPEVVGMEPEQMSLSIKISRTLGVSPRYEEQRICVLAELGEPLRLVFGRVAVGYKWLIKSYKIKYERFDKTGAPLDLTADLTLIEYPKE